MLQIYRRHKRGCEHSSKGVRYRYCKCPIWAYGTAGGQSVRKSLKMSNWEEASREIRDWEAAQEIPQATENDLSNAWKAMLSDLQARKISADTLRKYDLLHRQMMAFAQENHLTRLDQFDLDSLTQFRATWADGPRSANKKIERLRAFFRFCVDREWIKANPAKKLKSPKAKLVPTTPLTHADMVKILSAADSYILTAQPSGKPGAQRLKTLVLLMRYSGLRVGDAVTLETGRVTGDRLLLYTAKTGQAVYTILPNFVVRALEETPRLSENWYFWSGNGKRQTIIGDYQEKIKRLFAQAGIEKGKSNAVSHSFRDSYAVELLQAGVPIERVSVLLGHESIRVTEKHYSPWTRARQDQIEADLKAVWQRDPMLEDSKYSTRFVDEKKSSAIN